MTKRCVLIGGESHMTSSLRERRVFGQGGEVLAGDTGAFKTEK